MSIKVELDKLAEEMATRTIGYLITVDSEGPPHLGQANLHWVEGRIVAGAGKTACRHVAGGRPVSVMWPPVEEGGHTLIVDGTAEIVGEGDAAEVHITPTWAILHRRSRPDSPPSATGCKDDCVPMTTSE
ncbi:MAG: pyridoxamine 5'-phosphate oxidase family protein [Actinomycetia bacterium]|nr:pyridoxamine 5'-phosphate oxidase family protein [Actinomycetes bacterium]